MAQIDEDVIDGIADNAIVVNQPTDIPVSINIQEISSVFTLDFLRRIRNHFKTLGGVDETLTMYEFKDFLSSYLNLDDEVDSIYMNIDVHNEGIVRWRDFTSFLVTLEGNQKWSHVRREFSRRMNQKAFSLMENLNGVMSCILHSSHTPIGCVVSGDFEGNIKLWSSDLSSITCTVKHKDKNFIKSKEMMANLSRQHKTALAQAGKQLQVVNRKTAITAMSIMHGTTHLVVASADCCITVYDLAQPEGILTGCITSIEETPTAVAAFLAESLSGVADDSNTGLTASLLGGESSMVRASISIDNPSSSNNNNMIEPDGVPFIVYGDSKGNLHTLRLNTLFGSTTDAGAKSKCRIVMKHAVENGKIKHDKLHNDMINHIEYHEGIHLLTSCSNDGHVVLFDPWKREVRATYVGHRTLMKDTVRRAKWCGASKNIVSGGNCTLIIWDPFTLRTVSVLKDMTAPLIELQVDDNDDIIIGATEDKHIYVWNSLSYELLQIAHDSIYYRPDNKLSTMVYVPGSRMLYTGGNRITGWHNDVIRLEANKATNGGSVDDILVCLQNKSFKETIIVSTEGIVSVYHADTGATINQFSLQNSEEKALREEYHALHAGIKDPVVVHALLDKSERRLVVVTGTGLIQHWNFHSGACLNSIRPKWPTQYILRDGGEPKVTCCKFYSTTKGPRVDEEATGDVGISPIEHLYLLVGTDHGFVAGFRERPTGGIAAAPDLTLGVVAKHMNLESMSESLSLSISMQDGPSAIPGAITNGHGALDAAMNSLHESQAKSVIQVIPLAEDDGLVTVFYSDGSILVWALRTQRKITDLNVSETGAVINAMQKSARNSIMEVLSRKTGGDDDIDPVQQQIQKRESILQNQNQSVGSIDKNSSVISKGSVIYPHMQSRKSGVGRRRSSSIKSHVPRASIAAAVDNINGSISVIPGVTSDTSNGGAIFQPQPPSMPAPSFANSSVASATSAISNIIQGSQLPSVLDPSLSMESSTMMNRPNSQELNAQAQLYRKFFTVETAVYLESLGVVIAACSDGYFTFWDVGSGVSLCSCAYNDPDDSDKPMVSKLYLCLGEDVLIACYSDGTVRLWDVDLDALKTLADRRLRENTKQKTGKGLTVPGEELELYVSPLLVINDFQATGCEILSADFTAMADEESATSKENKNNNNNNNENNLDHNGGSKLVQERYMICSSKDQTTGLWGLDGTMIGLFSEGLWNLADEGTWGRNSRLDLGDVTSVKAKSSDDTFVFRPRGSVAMNNYVSALRRRNKQPKSFAQNAAYSHVNSKHPIKDWKHMLVDMSAESEFAPKTLYENTIATTTDGKISPSKSKRKGQVR